MDNNLFILCKQPDIIITRCHIVTWDINHSNFYTEYGLEIDRKELRNLDFQIYIPNLQSASDVFDLQSNLCDSTNNCRLIFNSEVLNCSAISGQSLLGKNVCLDDREFSIVPYINPKINKDGLFSFTIQIDKNKQKDYKQLLYVRFFVKTKKNPFSNTIKTMSKKIFDIEVRVNEQRTNLQGIKNSINKGAQIVKINKCYCLHIIPVDYNQDTIDTHKKNARIFESNDFQKYLGNIANSEKIQLVENSYDTIFLKSEGSDDYIFKSKFSKERFGLGQFIYSLSTNVIAGLLLAFITYSKAPNTTKLPLIIYSILIVICIFTFLPWNRWYKKIFHK